LGVLFIVSAEGAAGKTALCASLAINFLNGGKTAGYLKTMATAADPDTAFMKKVVGEANVLNSSEAAKGRDIVLVESALGPKVTDTKQTLGAVKEMNGRVIAVEAYSGLGSKYIDIYKWFDKNLLGVVLNKVPASQLKNVKEKATAQFSAAGIKVLGVIPESRAMLAVTIGELADIVKGKIVNNTEKSGELVENYMLGAMVLGSGINYFERKSKKAAIIHRDRPDMQMAALETPTACLVLSGSGEPPIDTVTQKGIAHGVPIISTEFTTPDIITALDDALAGSRMGQENKLAGLGDFIKYNLDMKAVA
jgi:uncharacterized protein